MPCRPLPWVGRRAQVPQRRTDPPDTAGDQRQTAACEQEPTAHSSWCSRNPSCPATPTGSGARSPGAMPSGTPAFRIRPSRSPVRTWTGFATRQRPTECGWPSGSPSATPRAPSTTQSSTSTTPEPMLGCIASSSRPVPNDWSGRTVKVRCSPWSTSVGCVGWAQVAQCPSSSSS